MLSDEIKMLPNDVISMAEELVAIKWPLYTGFVEYIMTEHTTVRDSDELRKLLQKDLEEACSRRWA
jgi:hypothetical protein